MKNEMLLLSHFTFPFLFYKEMHCTRQSPKSLLVLGHHDVKHVQISKNWRLGPVHKLSMKDQRLEALGTFNSLR